MISLWLNWGTPISVEGYFEGSPFDRNIFIILIIIGIFVLSRRKIEWSQILKSNVWFVLLFLYCGISILWSDFPLVSFKRWIKAIGSVIMVLIVHTDPNPNEAVKTMFRRCGYVLIPLSVLLYKYFPALGRKYHVFSGEMMITGVTMNKNSLGALCLISGIYFFWNIISTLQNKDKFVERKEVLFQILILSMTLWLLLISNSATSQICFIAGLCSFVLLGRSGLRKNIKYSGKYITLFVSFLMICVFIGFDFWLSSAVEYTGHSGTFWGRVKLWPELIQMMDAFPLVGEGYDSFWLGDRLAVLWEKYWWHPTEAHNGYVEILLELGIIGLCLYIAIIISVYRSICNQIVFEFEYGRYRMVSLVIFLIYNITESAIKGVHLIWFVFLLIAIEYPRRHSRFTAINNLSKESDPLSAISV